MRNWVIVIIVLFSLALIFPSNTVGYATEEHSEDKFERVVTVTSSEAKAIPSYVDQNFVWYREGLITQYELLNTLKYLLDNNIMFIFEDADALQKATGKHQTITPHTGSDEITTLEQILLFLGGFEKAIHEMEGHAGKWHFVYKFGVVIGEQEIVGIDELSTLNVGDVKNAGMRIGPRALGTPLLEISSDSVCGDVLCDTPMSVEEKIQMYLHSRGLS